MQVGEGAHGVGVIQEELEVCVFADGAWDCLGAHEMSRAGQECREAVWVKKGVWSAQEMLHEGVVQVRKGEWRYARGAVWARKGTQGGWQMPGRMCGGPQVPHGFGEGAGSSLGQETC